MSRLNYDQFLNAPNGIVAGEIATQAHGRVYGVLNSVIDDERTPPPASVPVLKKVRETVGNKADKRLDQAYGKPNLNQG
jgi:hypothetical protein